MDKLEDHKLLELYVKTHNLDYFGELYRRYIPLVYGLSLRYLQNSAEAEDAVMDIFEQLVPKVERYNIREFRTWIYSVARNHSLQLLRKKKREIPIELVEPVMESEEFLHLLDGEGNNPELEALQKCMEELPEEQRVSIKLFFMEERSYAEIAELQKFTLNGVKSYLQNGRRNLKNCIERRLGQ